MIDPRAPFRATRARRGVLIASIYHCLPTRGRSPTHLYPEGPIGFLSPSPSNVAAVARANVSSSNSPVVASRRAVVARRAPSIRVIRVRAIHPRPRRASAPVVVPRAVVVAVVVIAVVVVP